MTAMAPVQRRRPVVVVLGMMTKIPVAGVVWQTIHYLMGLELLGLDVYYVESHARTPSMLMEREEDDSSARAADFIGGVMSRFGLADRWAFHALHDDGAVYGRSRSELRRLYAKADAIVNLHGGTDPLPEHAATGRLVYVETDPVQLQIELYEQDPMAIAYLEPHVAFFTFGENYGRPDCGLPVSARFPFRPTRQPVVRDLWAPGRGDPGDAFTTIGNWRQPWRDVRFRGEVYHWTKHLEFEKFLDVPTRTGAAFELALSSYTDEDRVLLQGRGWRIAHALDFSTDLDAYRSYIVGSRGEFTVAKDQNVRLRTGWFSDRSATYLAAGRPVITQDTGFGNILPTGAGLFAFSTLDDVAAAVEEISRDPARHRGAALDVSRSCFDHDVVLRPLLEHIGVPVPRRRRVGRSADAALPFPTDLDLTVRRRRPTTLHEAALGAALGAPLPARRTDRACLPPAASIVVAVHDQLVFTRLCLETVLATTPPDVEIVVVDNASQDLTPAYLAELADRTGRVRTICNDTNRGFAVAINQGLTAARGDVLVILNNDTVVGPGWLDGLARHLADPSVGLVGPVTNGAPNEARVVVDYGTYGEFLQAAADRASSVPSSFDIPMLTMFCVALRREAFARVGALDEGYGVGMFEDDDYSLRVQRAGLRTICAEDVLVHHFGEATLGALVASGEHARVFAANRERFERSSGHPWTSHEGRPDDAYRTMVAGVHAAIADVVPEGATVLVVSKGDDELLAVPARVARHFPADADGGFAGWYAEGVDDVVRQIDREVARGAGYLVFPPTAGWWFDFYAGLESWIGRQFDEVGGTHACRIFAHRHAPHAAGAIA